MAQIRDITVVQISDHQYVLTTCDSSASIGEKEHDVLTVPPEITGKFALRVALLEMLCSGADVIAVTDVIGAEMEPTGKRIIAGIREELQAAELMQIDLNGSTEENMETTQTSVGVLVTGVASSDQLKLNTVTEDAAIFAIGEPRVGKEVLEVPSLEVSYQLVRQLVSKEEVLELVPVGSKGILYEAEQLAMFNECQLNEQAECPQNWLYKTAGPAMVLLIAIKKGCIENFKQLYPTAYYIGECIKHNQLP